MCIGLSIEAHSTVPFVSMGRTSIGSPCLSMSEVTIGVRPECAPSAQFRYMAIQTMYHATSVVTCRLDINMTLILIRNMKMKMMK